MLRRHVEEQASSSFGQSSAVASEVDECCAPPWVASTVDGRLRAP
jgi:hypothetical protein